MCSKLDFVPHNFSGFSLFHGYFSHVEKDFRVYSKLENLPRGAHLFSSRRGLPVGAILPPGPPRCGPMPTRPPPVAARTGIRTRILIGTVRGSPVRTPPLPQLAGVQLSPQLHPHFKCRRATSASSQLLTLPPQAVGLALGRAEHRSPRRRLRRAGAGCLPRAVIASSTSRHAPPVSSTAAPRQPP
jgi:hypothetical protein